MKTASRKLLFLTLSFTVLMSVPFLVPHAGWVALFALVPLLMMDELAVGEGVRHFFGWYYLAFLLWNLATTFWVCNATVGGGIFASAANALQMSVIFALFRLFRRRIPGGASYMFLAFLWIAWERWYYSAEISWPWLVLGNSFARTLSLAQWYEWTGVLGGSLWIWISNILIFAALKYRHAADDFPRRRRIGLNVCLAAVLIIPAAVSIFIDNTYVPRSSGSLDVVIGQPDFDPYHKFESMSQAEQNSVLLDLFRQGIGEHDRTAADSAAPLLLLAPETFTSDIVLGSPQSSPTWQSFLSFLQSERDANILFGAVTTGLFYQNGRPSVLSRQVRPGLWAEHHNSALIMDGSGRTEVFHKSKLVVGTEKTPYPKLFTRIDDALGGVMGRDVPQDHISLLNFLSADGRVDVPLGCAVCYESVYGEYCTGYVREGARALAVITNDAWWGDTPGYRQHLSYASLRAIETRRDIVRCANTGISAFIDQRGRITKASQWWTPQTLVGRIDLNDSQTAFVRYGDVTGRASSLAALLLVLAYIILPIKRKL